MSKELEALYNLVSRLEPSKDNLAKAETDIKIIETGLKALETLEEEKQSFDRQLEKKLKALEIIKEKKVDCFIFIDGFMNEDWSYEHYVKYISDYPDEILTKEEYDLLKEVLCDGK